MARGGNPVQIAKKRERVRLIVNIMKKGFLSTYDIKKYIDERNQIDKNGVYKFDVSMRTVEDDIKEAKSVYNKEGKRDINNLFVFINDEFKEVLEQAGLEKNHKAYADALMNIAKLNGLLDGDILKKVILRDKLKEVQREEVEEVQSEKKKVASDETLTFEQIIEKRERRREESKAKII